MKKKIDFTKVDIPLMAHILKYFYAREDLEYLGYTGTYFFEKKESIFSIEKPQFSKDTVNKVVVMVFTQRLEQDNKFGVEFRIEYAIHSDPDMVTVFSGWAESKEEFNIIIKAIGLLKDE